MTSQHYRAAFSLIAVTLVAAFAVLGFPAEALAATGSLPSKVSFSDLISLAAPTLVALRLQVDEISRRAAAKMAEAKEGLDEAALRKIEEEHAAILKEADPIRAQITDEERRLTTAQAAPPATQPDASAVLTPERERTATIMDLADRFDMRTLGATAIKDGTSVDEFRAAVLKKMADKQPSISSTAPTAEVIGPNGGEARGQAIIDALLHRYDPAAYPMKNEGARDFRGMSLLEIARDCLSASGINTRGLTRNELAQTALGTGTRTSGGMHSTADFPFILANVANKTLRQAYEAAPQTFRPFTRVTSVADFKQQSRLALGDAPQFEKVNESGEFRRGTLTESREVYSVATYGKVVAITRQVIINDDLGAFTRVPMLFGRQAANLESDLVWAQLLANANMADGFALFASQHGNLAGVGAGISVDTIAAAREAMRIQKGLDGVTPLNLIPQYLIVPVAAETKALQLVYPIQPTQISNANVDYIRQLTVISEPRLDSGVTHPFTRQFITGSRFNWYMAADPGQIDTIELAYLEGNQGVYTETRTGFDVDGVEVKVRMDVGAKVIDWRGFYRNPAAAL